MASALFAAGHFSPSFLPSIVGDHLSRELEFPFTNIYGANLFCRLVNDVHLIPSFLTYLTFVLERIGNHPYSLFAILVAWTYL